MPPLTQTQTSTINNANQNAVVNANNLENPVTTPNLPTTQPPAVPSIGTFIGQQGTTQDQQVQDLQGQEKSAFESLFGAMQGTENRGAQVTALENQAGIPQLTTDLADIQNQIMQKELEFRRQREAIVNRAGISTAEQRNAELADVSRKQSAELADLEVVRAARSNSLNAIQSIIDRKVERQFKDEDTRINNLKFTYEAVKGDLTKAQDRQYNEMIKREERAYNIAKGKYEQLETAKGELVKNAQLNGAPAATLAKIMSAQKLEDAYSFAGGYGLSIDDKIKRAQYSKAMRELAGGDTGAISETDLTGVPSQDMAKIIKATGAKNNANIQNALGVIKGLETFAGRNPEGTFMGMAPIRFLPAVFRGAKAKTERQFNLGDISAINLKVQQWASGASLTKEQTKQVQRLVPDKNDTDAQVKRKVNQLTQYMLNQVGGELAAQGIESTAPSFDFFNTQTNFQIDANGNVVIPGDASDEDFWSTNR